MGEAGRLMTPCRGLAKSTSRPMLRASIKAGGHRANGPAPTTGGVTPMATRKGNDPFKRRKTRYKGITFRVLNDGSRRYAYYRAGTHINVDGGERDVLAA